jgi:hypothetical protein
MDLLRSPVVRLIIRARELVLGATPDERPRPHGLLAEVQALGWGVLAESRWQTTEARQGRAVTPRSTTASSHPW